MKVTIEFPVDENFAEKTNAIQKIGVEFMATWKGQGCCFESNIRDIVYDIDKANAEDFIKEINKIENVKVKTK